MIIIKVFLSTVVGTVASAVIGLFPALHVYNVVMLFIVFYSYVAKTSLGSDPYVVLPLMMGLVVGWAVLNTVPAIFLGSPDESSMLMVLA